MVELVLGIGCMIEYCTPVCVLTQYDFYIHDIFLNSSYVHQLLQIIHIIFCQIDKFHQENFQIDQPFNQ